MKNSQVILFLKKFTPRELKKLEQMLVSPYFNTTALCLPLYQLIKEEVLKKGKELNKNELFKALFPEGKHSPNSLNVVMSKLLKIAEEVMIQEQLRLRPHTRNHLLMKAMGEKGDAKSIKKIGNQSLQMLEKTNKMTREDYRIRYLITNLLYELDVTSDQGRKQQPEAVVEALDSFYLSHRLPITYEMLGLQQLMSVNYHIVMTDRLLELAKTIPLEKFHLIELYRQSILLVKEEKESHFETYLSSLEKYASSIPKDELHSLYAIGQNYCIQQIINGKREYYQHLFGIYNKMIARKVLFITKYIPAGLIKNVIALSCQIGEYTWAHQFLLTYSSDLAPQTRQQTVDFYLATIFFYEKNYEKARELLVQTQRMDVFFEISRKFVLLKIYYELGEEIALFQLLNSFTAFIRSNKSLSPNMKTSYLNFANLLKLISNAKHSPTPQLSKKLEQKLNAYAQISDKRWLLEKILEID